MSEEKNRILKLIDIPFVKPVLFSAGTLLVSVSAYFGTNYFDSSYQKSEQIYQYKDDNYKKLYEESKPEIISLRQSIGSLLSFMQNNYGISSYEMKQALSNFEESIKSYDNYVDKLEFLGNSQQIASAKAIQDWVYSIHRNGREASSLSLTER